MHYAGVAQLDRVPGYEPGGQGFESLHPHHLFSSSFFRLYYLDYTIHLIYINFCYLLLLPLQIYNYLLIYQQILKLLNIINALAWYSADLYFLNIKSCEPLLNEK